ncbi:MAG: MarR family transcriptional regulator [Vicinamibacteria bacterium]|nr:MarR family transcriptional regulator [Vicinamibacteria bacterium]
MAVTPRRRRSVAAPDRVRVSASELNDVLQFMRLLWAIVHALDTASKRMSRHLGVTGPQRLVLRVVGIFPGLSAGQLAATLHVHPSTLTGVLRRLVRQKLLKRARHASDRRRAVLHLTPRGETLNAVTRGTVEESVARALGLASDRDRKATQRVLALLGDGLGRPMPANDRDG